MTNGGRERSIFVINETARTTKIPGNIFKTTRTNAKLLELFMKRKINENTSNFFFSQCSAVNTIGECKYNPDEDIIFTA